MEGAIKFSISLGIDIYNESSVLMGLTGKSRSRYIQDALRLYNKTQKKVSILEYLETLSKDEKKILLDELTRQ